MLGTWITSPSPHSLDAICKSNIDFVILDQEHGSISANDLLPLINVAKAHNVAPIDTLTAMQDVMGSVSKYQQS